MCLTITFESLTAYACPMPTDRHAMELEDLRLGMRGAMAAQLQAAQTAHEEVQIPGRLEFSIFWQSCSKLTA